MARLNLFAGMAALNKEDVAWGARKVNFHLLVVACLTGKAELAKEARTIAKVVQMAQKAKMHEMSGGSTDEKGMGKVREQPLTPSVHTSIHTICPPLA